MKNQQALDSLKNYFRHSDDIEFAESVGSQESSQATETSDWDTAVRRTRTDED